MLDDGRDVDQAGQRLAPLRLLGEEREQAEVALDLLGRARALHLDHDALAALEPRAVHLPDRPGRERLWLDVLEHVLPRDPQLLLHHLHDLRLGQRRHVVLQARELVGDVGRDQVGPRREDLAELGEGRAELLERLAQAGGPVRALLAAVVKAVLGDDGGDPGGARRQVPAGELGLRPAPRALLLRLARRCSRSRPYSARCARRGWGRCRAGTRGGRSSRGCRRRGRRPSPRRRRRRSRRADPRRRCTRAFEPGPPISSA